jgi:hypothetical protein
MKFNSMGFTHSTTRKVQFNIKEGGIILQNHNKFRVQLIVSIITIIMILIDTFIAIISVATTSRLMAGNAVPDLTQFYMWIGPIGIILMSLGSILAMGIFTFINRGRMSLILSVSIAIIIIIFLRIAIIASVYPFWCGTSRLTGGK